MRDTCQLRVSGRIQENLTRTGSLSDTVYFRTTTAISCSPSLVRDRNVGRPR